MFPLTYMEVSSCWAGSPASSPPLSSSRARFLRICLCLPDIEALWGRTHSRVTLMCVWPRSKWQRYTQAPVTATDSGLGTLGGPVGLLQPCYCEVLLPGSVSK